MLKDQGKYIEALTSHLYAPEPENEPNSNRCFQNAIEPNRVLQNEVEPNRTRTAAFKMRSNRTELEPCFIL